MTRFDFDVIGDSPRLVSRPPDNAPAKPMAEKPSVPDRAPLERPTAKQAEPAT